MNVQQSTYVHASTLEPGDLLIDWQDRTIRVADIAHDGPELVRLTLIRTRGILDPRLEVDTVTVGGRTMVALAAAVTVVDLATAEIIDACYPPAFGARPVTAR